MRTRLSASLVDIRFGRHSGSFCRTYIFSLDRHQIRLASRTIHFSLASNGSGPKARQVPLSAIASPMVLGLPALKDLPVLDFSFRRLFACLDVLTAESIVLGFLASNES